MTVKVAIAQINSTVGDFAGNRAKIVEFRASGGAQGADIVLTPECRWSAIRRKTCCCVTFYAKTAEVSSAGSRLHLPDVHVMVGHPTLRRNGMRTMQLR